MEIFFSALIYTILGLIIFLSKMKKKLLVFLIALMSSGFFYLSAFSLLAYLLYINFKNPKLHTYKIFFFLIIFLVVIISSITNLDTGFSFFEILQFFVFLALFIFLRSDLFTDQDFKSIPLGFFIGSILISALIIYKNFILNDLNQDNFEFFSISKTYNYTAYYLIFGLVFSPYLLFNSYFKRLTIFIIFSIAIYSLESRSGLLIGTLVFIYFSLKNDNTFKLIFGLGFFASLLFLIVNSSLFDPNNQNDLFFSILNFEDNFSNLERLTMFLGSFKNLENYPFGIGLDNTHIALSYIGIDHPHSHNTLSNWIYDFGYLGILLYSTFVFFLFRIFLKSKNMVNKVSKFNYSIIFYLFFFSIVSSLQYNALVILITYFSLLTLVSYNKIESQSILDD